MTLRVSLQRWRPISTGEAGATAVEYTLMVSLIALVIFGAVSLIGPKLAVIFNQAAASL